MPSCFLVIMVSSRKLKSWGMAYLLILPSFIFLILFTFYPIAYSAVTSLMEGSHGSADAIGFGNYRAMFSSREFREAIANNAVYAVCSTVPAVLFGLLLAIVLNTRIRGKGFYRFAVFYPTILPIATASMIWVFLLSQSIGLVNHILGFLGLPSKIDWVNTSPYAMVSIIIVYIWKYSGYYMLLFLSGLQSIDRSLYEEAYLEGAGAWQRLRMVTLPLLSPTSFFVILLAIVNSFQAVDQIYVMTKGGPHNSTDVLLYYIYEYGFVYWEPGMASSASALLFAFLLILTFFYWFGGQRMVNYER